MLCLMETTSTRINKDYIRVKTVGAGKKQLITRTVEKLSASGPRRKLMTNSISMTVLVGKYPLYLA